MLSRHPLIVDVARFGLHDGPGIRTVIFFKGCPLRCIFCHNPETQVYQTEIAFFRKDCVKCYTCVAACPNNAIDFDYDYPLLSRKCDACGRCVEECPSGAIRLFGKYYTEQSLAELIFRDIDYYSCSGGGITLSGGECGMFPEYLNTFLEQVKRRDVHVLMETSGYFDYEKFRDLALPFIDTIYFDIKLIDPKDHMTFCGRSNFRILENFLKLLNEPAVSVEPRIPLIPGITDTEQNLSGIISFLKKSGVRNVSTVPYNPTAAPKYQALRRQAPDLSKRFMNRQELDRIHEILKKAMSL